MDKDSVLRAPTHVVARTVGDEVVLLDLQSGTYFGLDPVGARIWQLLVEGLRPSEICDRLLREYEVGPAQLGTDIHRLIGELKEKGLLANG